MAPSRSTRIDFCARKGDAASPAEWLDGGDNRDRRGGRDSGDNRMVGTAGTAVPPATPGCSSRHQPLAPGPEGPSTTHPGTPMPPGWLRPAALVANGLCAVTPTPPAPDSAPPLWAARSSAVPAGLSGADGPGVGRTEAAQRVLSFMHTQRDSRAGSGGAVAFGASAGGTFYKGSASLALGDRRFRQIRPH